MLYGVHGLIHKGSEEFAGMALGTIQPLTEMSTRDISWGVRVDSA